jgi:lipoyl synthase
MEVMSSRLPSWFKKKMPDPAAMVSMRNVLDGLNLNTVCEHALCPNIGECFQCKTATFLIMGNICTRNCAYCAVKKGNPDSLDNDEPQHVADAVKKLGLKHVVLTSVTRDDLPDYGACHFTSTIDHIRKQVPQITIEVLIPDFKGELAPIRNVVTAHPDVINHNMETVHRLYPTVRPKADYQRSLQLLALVKHIDSSIITKSGLMVGLGETKEELYQTMEDLREVDCDLLTIGQYLQPSPAHLPIERYIPPEEFEEYASRAESMGFYGAACAPLVRSSYKAGQLYFNALEKVRVS